MANKFVLSQLDGAVLKVTLNRPDVLNSFNREMALELQTALSKAANDNVVRAVLLTGAGRAFCTGQDLAEVAPIPNAPPRDLGKIVREHYNPIIRAIRNIEKPVVCAVNGIAAGAGANLAFACDIVFASKDASFVQSFCKVGLIPDSGGTFFLPRLVGLVRATALMMLGDKISAEQALSYGLIYKVCEPAVFLEEAMSLSQHLASQPTRGLGLIKRGLNRSLNNNLESQLVLEEELQRLAGQTLDYNEGVNAFLLKRKPIFKGE